VRALWSVSGEMNDEFTRPRALSNVNISVSCHTTVRFNLDIGMFFDILTRGCLGTNTSTTGN